MNTRQSVFVNEYLICWNSAEAARRAGYNGKSNVIGPRLLADVSIRAEIDAKLAEYKMSANEVLKRLSDMARSDIADFADVHTITDLQKEEYKGKTHVIKKFKNKITRNSITGMEYEEIELELYGADSVLVNLGKHHKLFTDSIRVDDWRTELIELFKQGKLTKEQVLNEFADAPSLAQELFESIGLSAIESRQVEVDSESDAMAD